MVTLTNTKEHYALTLPTSMKEVNYEDLLKLVENVNLNEHYLIVGLIQKFSMTNLLLLGGKSNKEAVASVTPIFIKSNDPNCKVKAKLGDRIISSRSDLERSIHLPMNVGISSSMLTRTINESNEVMNMIKKGLTDNDGELVKQIICVEFKILPLTGIYAVVDSDIKVKDEYFNAIAE